MNELSLSLFLMLLGNDSRTPNVSPTLGGYYNKVHPYVNLFVRKRKEDMGIRTREYYSVYYKYTSRPPVSLILLPEREPFTCTPYACRRDVLYV